MDFEADDYCRGPVLELVETCARFCTSTVGLPFLVVTATDSALLSWHDLVGVSHVFLQLFSLPVLLIPLLALLHIALKITSKSAVVNVPKPLDNDLGIQMRIGNPA